MASFKITGGRVSTVAEIAAQRRILQAQSNQIQSVRVMAESWRNAVGFLTTALGSTTFIAGPDVIAKSSSQNTTNGGWALALGFIALVLSVACSLRASAGWPKWVTIENSYALDRWESNEARVAVRCLRASMILAVAALLLLGVAGAVLVFQVSLPFCMPSW